MLDTYSSLAMIERMSGGIPFRRPQNRYSERNDVVASHVATVERGRPELRAARSPRRTSRPVGEVACLADGRQRVDQDGVLLAGDQRCRDRRPQSLPPRPGAAWIGWRPPIHTSRQAGTAAPPYQRLRGSVAAGRLVPTVNIQVTGQITVKRS